MRRHRIKTHSVITIVFNVLFVCYGSLAFAQQTASPVGVWKTYRYVDGLANNTVTSVLQSADGSLWFGTLHGLSRFDGKNWTTYTAPDQLGGNTIHALVEGNDGAIWVGTDRGLSRFDGKTWQTDREAEGLADANVEALLAAKDGTIWVGTRRGISRLVVSEARSSDGNRWKNYRPDDGVPPGPISALIEDKSQNIWVGGAFGGLARYDGQRWHRVVTTDRAPLRRISALLQDRTQRIWVGAVGRGVVRYDGQLWANIGTSEGLSDDVVHTMLQDDTGNIWFGTENGGVCRYDGSHWRSYTTADGLGGNSVSAILQDREGAFWFGTDGGGVSRLDMRSWQVFTQKDGLPSDKVNAILQDAEGAMWFGTASGASRFDGKTWQTYTRREGLRPDQVNAMLDDAGDMWFGTFGGFSRFDGQRWTNYSRRSGFRVDDVGAMLKAQDGAVWIGTSGATRPGQGVMRFDGQEWKTYTQSDGLADNAVTAIFQAKDGAIWFGTGGPESIPGGGVSRFDGATWKTYTTTDGLASNKVLSVYQDSRGDMWFGTHGGGVSQFDGSRWTTYTTDDGLGSNNVSAILQDATGIMWFGTLDGGISRYNGRFFQTIDSRDGLPNDSVVTLYIDRNRTVWAGTLGGAIRFLRAPSVQPPIRIANIVADDRVFRQLDGPIRLPAGVKRVVFRYHAISFKTRPGGMRYYYQMVGHDATWQKPVNKEEVEYFNLKPRHYTFQVQAIDRDLNYSGLASVRFQIPVAFHQTTGFVWMVGSATVSLIATLALLIVAFIKHRLRIRDYQEMLRRELRDAREVQMSLLPRETPVIEGFDIAGICDPAAEVGGDYFTYLWLDDDRTQLGIVLIDVTGHGMKAAATTFLVNGMLQSESRSEKQPDQILAKMHRSLQGVLPKNAFVAMGFALIDASDYTLTHFNAGLAEPILLRHGQPVALPIQSTVPLGVRLDAQHQGTTTSLKPGDTFIFFSDGLIEAINKKGEVYGEKRLMEFLTLLSLGKQSAQAWVEALRGDLHAFVSPAEPSDDMTLVVVRVLL